MTATITPIGRAADVPSTHTRAALSPRVDELLQAHYGQGFLDGEREGYFKGLRWGSVSWLVVGLIVGVLIRHALGPLT